MRLLVSGCLCLLAVACPAQFLAPRLRQPASPLGYYNRSQEAYRLYNSQKYPEAAEALKAVVAEYPLDGNAWMTLGRSLFMAHKAKEAIPAYLKAQQLHIKDSYWWIDYSLAEAYAALGNKQAAIKSLETLVYEDAYHGRPYLYADFPTLRTEPRFIKLAGRIDTSKMSRTQGWRTDIDHYVSEIKRVNHLYHWKPFPKEFMARYAQLKADVPKLTDDQIFTGLGAIVSTLHQGHMSITLSSDTKLSPLQTVPVQFFAFAEGIYIIGADETHRSLVGSKVLKVEQTPAEEVMLRVESHSSVENPMKIFFSGMRRMGTLQFLRGIGVVPAGKKDVQLTLVTPDGKTVRPVLGTVPRDQNRFLVPPAGVATPLFLKDVDNPHWFEPMPESDAVYAQVNGIDDAEKETLAQYGLKLRAFLTEHPTKNVILDLRHNNGGSTSLYPELVRTLVAHTTKEGNRLYVLIGRTSYSATGNLMTDLERFAEPIFVGEPSAGFGNQDGDESAILLPYSGVHATVTSVRWQLSHPWDKRTSIVPDIPVQLTAKAYFAGKDPALETVLEAIREGGKPKVVPYNP